MGRGIGKLIRERVISLYGQNCWWCGCETIIYAPATVPERPPSNAFTVDHKKPRAKGGWHGLENLRPSCYACNELKGDEEWDDEGRLQGATFSLADIWPRPNQDRSDGEHEHQSTAESEPAPLARSSREPQP